MTTVSKIQTLAIAAAKANNWQQAIEHNKEILAQFPNDIAALNRLGMAYLQLAQPDEAKGLFSQVLELDKHNSIAQKQLDRIKSKQMPPSPAFTRTHFIEEPGKTKIVELHRLSGKQLLDTLSVGQSCNLKLKNRYISIETADGQYVGALPEDISFRLTKLIQTGNTYHCSIHSCSASECSVYLKELIRSAQNTDVHSFPPSKSAGSQLDIDDRVLLEELENEDGIVESEDDEVEELDSQRERRSPANQDFDD